MRRSYDLFTFTYCAASSAALCLPYDHLPLRPGMTKNQLREVRVFNAYDFFSVGDRIFIDYSPATVGRGSMSAKWQVVRYRDGQKVVTDPNAAWYNNKSKTFSVYSRNEKQAQLEAAQKWATEKYGIQEWAKASPFDAYGSAAFVKARQGQLRKQYRELQSEANA